MWRFRAFPVIRRAKLDSYVKVLLCPFYDELSEVGTECFNGPLSACDFHCRVLGIELGGGRRGALLGHLSRGRKSKRDLSHLRFPQQQQQQKSPLILWWLGGKGSQEDRRYTGFPEAHVTSRLSHALPWRQNKVLGRRAGTLSSATSSNTWASRTGDVSVP